MLRRQPPAHSPVPWEAWRSGVAAAVAGNPGRLIREVCDSLADTFGARKVLLTDSGTSALRLALAGVAAETDEPLGLPGYSCYDIASAVEGAGVRAALYDVDPTTIGPDPGSLEELVTGGVGAVVVGHLFGHVVDVPAVEASLGGVMLIEDAAQGVGGWIGGRRCGSFGSLAVLSFGRGKGMTGGGGGALLAHDERGERVLTRIRDQVDGRGPRGWKTVVTLAAQAVLGRPALYGIPSALPFLRLGETVYHPPKVPGPPARFSLAVLAEVLGRVDEERAVRARHATRLLEALRESSRARGPRPVPGARPGFLRLPAVLTGDASLLDPPGSGRLGIARGYPKPLDALPSLRPQLVRDRPLPGAELLARRLITLPTHRFLSERDLVALEGWLGQEKSLA